MERIATTPFGQRSVSAGLLASLDRAGDQPALPQVDKWSVLNNLTTARQAFGVTDRDLTVLSALISFHPAKVLGDNAPLIVYPSNRALGDRAHGMAESTLRRHLAALVNAGLILRHDSPNGKRYAAKDRAGDVTRAFGFDLRPLLVRADEIANAASAAQDAAEQQKRLREGLTLKRRDALKLAAYGAEQGLPGDWGGVMDELAQIHKANRRKLDMATLMDLTATVDKLLDTIHALLNISEKTSGSDDHFGRHYHNSNKDSSDSEPCLESNGAGATAPDVNDVQPDGPQDLPNIPLPLILKACPDIVPYADGPIRHWHQLISTASDVRGMMGISASAWAEACGAMGFEQAAVTVACILQRFADIHSPGGYLRALTRKAQAGGFSIGPMIMAQLNTGPGGQVN